MCLHYEFSKRHKGRTTNLCHKKLLVPDLITKKEKIRCATNEHCNKSETKHKMGKKIIEQSQNDYKKKQQQIVNKSQFNRKSSFHS